MKTSQMKSTGNIKVCRASAGSGKTFALVSEYIARTIDAPIGVTPYSSVLAITFTNKATGEMKMRILNTLSNIARGKKKGDDYLEAVYSLLSGRMTRENIRKQCGYAIAAILDGYDSFDVRTIDSFFQRIIKDIAAMIGYNSDLQVFLSDSEAIDTAVDTLVNKAASGADTTLSWQMDNYIALNLDDSDSWDFRKKLKQFGTTVCSEIYMRSADRIDRVFGDRKQFEDLIKVLNADRAVMESSIAALPSSLNIDFSRVKFGGKILTYVDKVGNAKVYEKEDNLEKPKSVNSLIIGDYGKNPKAPIADLEKWSKEMAAFELQKKKLYTQYISDGLILNHLNEMRMLQTIDSEVKRESRDSGRILLSKSQELLREQLRDSGDISFVFERAGRRYRHIMLDEAQDTSSMQFENLSKLIDNVCATGSNSCLTVGDVKQSIYRFRGGDWEILRELGEKYDPDGCNTLHTNYRSYGNIIGFNNALFSAISRCYNVLYGNLYSDVEQEIPDSVLGLGHVEIARYTDGEPDDLGCELDLKSQECYGLLNNIRKAMAKGVDPEDMAILCRTAKDIALISDFMAEKAPDIKILTQEAYDITNSLAVKMLVAAMRYLNGEATGYSDMISGFYAAREYARLCEGESYQEPHFSAGNSTAAADYIRATLPSEISEGSNYLIRLPLMELVMRLMAILKVDRIKSETQYICTFADYISSYSLINPYDITKFLDDWGTEGSQQHIVSGEEHSIRALTIHKAKGLEFHTVFIPFCDWPFTQNGKKSVMWCEPEGGIYDKVPLVPIDFVKKTKMSIFSDDYDREARNIMIDNLNYLYVALTRAKANLFIGYGSKSQPTDRPLPLPPVTSIRVADLLDRALLEFDPKEYCGDISISHVEKKAMESEVFSTEGEKRDFELSEMR